MRVCHHKFKRSHSKEAEYLYMTCLCSCPLVTKIAKGIKSIHISNLQNHAVFVTRVLGFKIYESQKCHLNPLKYAA